MAEIVEVDKSGRIVIPKKLRKDLGIEEIAERLGKELEGKDIDAIVKEVRKEINEKVRSKYPDLLT